MGAINNSVLPEDFLAKPASNIIAQRINFTQVNLNEYKGLYAVIIDNVLTPEECDLFVEAAEATTSLGWERAMVNVGGGRQMLIADTRNCGRIIWDSHELVDKVWNRIAHLPDVQEIVRLQNVPKIVGNGPAKRGEVWKFTRLNERMRFLKYVGGEYFRPHCDGTYETPDRTERSYVTLHLYLNNAGVVNSEDLDKKEVKRRMEKNESVLVGGATTFHSWKMDKGVDVLPKAGRILLFQHRELIHSGDDVLRGTKYTMRTDLMYTLEKTESNEESKGPTLRSEPQVTLEEATDGMAEAMRYMQ